MCSSDLTLCFTRQEEAVAEQLLLSAVDAMQEVTWQVNQDVIA